MRTVKTKNSLIGVENKGKPIILSSRDKARILKGKEKAGGEANEAQNNSYASPVDYAIAQTQDKTKNAMVETSRYGGVAFKRVHGNIDRRKNSELSIVKNKAAAQVTPNAGDTRKSADKAKRTTGEVKHTLREVQQTGRKTSTDAKREYYSKKQTNKKSVSDVKSNNATTTSKGNAVDNGVTRPGYLNKSVSLRRSSGDLGKSVGGNSVEAARKTAKGSIKTAKKTVKTADRTAKLAVKNARRTAKISQNTVKGAVKTIKTTQKVGKVSVAAVKLTIKAVASMVKAVIAAVKSLVAVIMAGGWVAVAIILVICMIAMLVNSVFGIFFSRSPNPRTGQTLNSVLTEIDLEYTARIDEIVSSNTHDLLDMSGARAAWRHVLAIYTVRTVLDSENPMEVAMMTDERADILREVFWDMNTISYILDTVEVEIEELDANDIPTGETEIITQIVLRIYVTHMTTAEAAVFYGFSDEQLTWLEELLKPDYNPFWNMLLFGITSVGDGTMLEIALTQLGNIGGEIYWRWFGFQSREPWCAIFVSWVAEQCGFIEAGVFPRFSWCDDGIAWFVSRGQWMDRDYIPSPGDIIFFDWDGDGSSDHVGIVERVEGEFVHTVEGNTSDSVARRVRRLDSVTIMGYGVVVP